MRLLLAEDGKIIIKSVSYEEVLKPSEIRKSDSNLMLTAKAEIDDKVEGLDLGRMIICKTICGKRIVGKNPYHDQNADNTNRINFVCRKYHIKQSDF